MSERYPTLYFVTGEDQKFKVYDDILDTINLKWSEISVDARQSLLFDVIIKDKINVVSPTLPELPFFVEHSGVTIRSWNNMPGGLTSIFMQTVGAEGICRMMQAYELPEEREAVATTVIGYCSSDGHLELFRSEMPGRIAESPRGEGYFGWDTIFIPDGHQRTYAEMESEELEQAFVSRIAASKFFKTVIKQQFQYSEVPGAVAEDMETSEIPDVDLGGLRKRIARHFNEDELNTLCFDLGIDFNSLKGGTIDGKSRELVAYCDRTLHLSDLIAACREARSKVDWDDFQSKVEKSD